MRKFQIMLSRCSLKGSSSRTQRRCALCCMPNHQLSAPKQWKNGSARKLAASWGVDVDSSVCKPYRDDITKCLANPGHEPRWCRSLRAPKKCCIVKCRGNASHCSEIAGSDEMASLLLKAGLECKSATVPVPTPFCKQHYHLVYNLHRPTQTHCKTCSISLKHSSPTPCPQPKVIEQHLRDNSGFDDTIQPEDKVCNSCYKSHLTTLKAEKVLSTDNDLKQLINLYTHKIVQESDAHTCEEIIETTMTRITVDVGKKLLRREVFSLPTVFDSFVATAGDICKTTNKNLDNLNSLVSPRWILSNLTANLQHHILYSCWVLSMWKQATKNTMIVKPITDYGWSVVNDKLTVVWDTDDNIKCVQARVALLLDGCKCKTGCGTRHCKCVKNNRQCLEGCQCTNCRNTGFASSSNAELNDLSTLSLEEDVAQSSIHSHNEYENTEELLDWVFGPENVQDSDND